MKRDARRTSRRPNNSEAQSGEKGSLIKALLKPSFKGNQNNGTDILSQSYPGLLFQLRLAASGGGMTREEAKGTSVPKDAFPLRIHVLRQTTSLFGHNAPQKISLKDGSLINEPQTLVDDDQTENILHLDNTYNKILPESWIVVRRENEDAATTGNPPFLISRAEKVTSGISRSAYDLAGKTTRIVLKRNDASKLTDFAELRQTVIYAQSEDLTAKLAEESIEADVKGKILELDGYYDGLEKGRSLIVSGQARAGTGTIIAAAEKVVLADTWHGLLTTMPGTPAPQIELSNDKKSISVNRWEAYSKELFEEAPEFAACSKGAIPRRTCVQVKKWDGTANGIPDIIADISTDIDYSKGLEKLDFPIGSNIDSGFIFLELRDRAKNVSFISNLVEKELYVFSWTDNDDQRLKEFLGKRYDIDWLNNATITKSDDKKTICMSNDGATLSLTLNNGESEVILKIDNIETDKFIARMENNVLNIYKESTSKITSPSVVLMERKFDKEKNHISYEFSVTNWSDYTDDEIKITKISFYYNRKNNIPPIKNITSNKDLASLSFEVDASDSSFQEPQYFYIGIGQGVNECLSNLISTVPNSFLPGDSPHTTLILAEDLENVYLRDTVKIYANLARATHGETRNEVLGSGDSAQVLQQFKLRHYPLTYLPAPTPTGAVSTLELRVNDVLWHESDSLLGLGPRDRSYIIRTNAEIKSSVTFGNGQKGARLPTGVENIKAKYRNGIGKPGNVRAGQISLLATKPLGLKGVINPLPASGGADPESNDQARRNAPLTVMALDRLVSVQDYEDLARSFAGIGKASAALLTDGRREVVHVSIAGVDDIPIDEDSDLFQNLLLALRRAGDPHQPLVLDLCERLILLIRAKVRLLPDYEWQSVEPKIRAALLQAFGFANRDPGQEVFRSEIISVIQAVPGVAYVDLDLVDDISEREALDLVKTTQKIRSLMDELSRSSSSAEAADGKPVPVTQDRIDVEIARVAKTHTVADGETLASIAELYDLGVDHNLMVLNPNLSNKKDDELLKGPTSTDKMTIKIWPQLLPAQIAYLSADIPEAVVLKELI
jgi:hypothetical protein